jgi:hypothetical protein
VLGLLDKGGGGGGADHLHLEAARELLPLIAEKRAGGRGGALLLGGKGQSPTPQYREAGTREKAAGGRVREAKVRAAFTNYLPFRRRIQGDLSRGAECRP